MDALPDPGLPSGIAIVIILALVFFMAVLSVAEKGANITGRQKDEPVNHFSLVSVILLAEFGVFVTTYLWLDNPLQNLMEDMAPWIRAFLIPFVLVFGVALVCLVFGRIYPGKWAARKQDKAAVVAEKWTPRLVSLFRPYLWLISGLVNLLLKMTGQKIHLEDPEFSEEEVMSMLETGQEKGALKEEGKKMIDSIFALDDKYAYEIMTPRTDVFAIDIDDAPEKYLDELMELKYSRIPVYEEDSDNIVGVFHIKDYLIKAREDGFDRVDIRSILRKPYFVPDTKYIDTLFLELQKTRQHIAILIDEYGGFSGIVTMEDIIEEVMGDIDDEYDEEEEKIQSLGDNVYLLDGTYALDDINDELGTDLDSENIETLGGLLIEILGEIPEDGSAGLVVRHGRYMFTIESVKEKRIGRVRMELLDGQEALKKSEGKDLESQ